MRRLGSGRATPLLGADHEDRVPARPGTTRTRRARLTRWFNRALWTVIVVCMAVYVATLAVPMWYQWQGQRLLIVTSGSMSGTRDGGFDAGDAVVLQAIDDPSELQVGQVVTFWPVGSEHLATHRIIAMHMLPQLEQDSSTGSMVPTIDPATGEKIMRPYIITQGDANSAPDPDATPLSRVRGVVLAVHSGWGWVLQWAQSNSGRFIMLAPPLVGLAILEIGSLLRERKAERRRTPARVKINDDELDALTGES